MTRSAAALLAATLADKPVVVDVRASLNHFTAWRRLDEMPAYAVAR